MQHTRLETIWDGNSALRKARRKTVFPKLKSEETHQADWIRIRCCKSVPLVVILRSGKKLSVLACERLFRSRFKAEKEMAAKLG
mgnify:CR=1 FL=1